MNRSKLKSISNSNHDISLLDKQEMDSCLSHHNYLAHCIADDKIQHHQDKIKEDMRIKLSQSSQEIANQSAELDAMNRRLKDIALFATQQRMINQQESERDKLENTYRTTNIDKVLENLLDKQNVYCNRLATKNIDFGYSETEGFSKLNAALEESLNLLKTTHENDPEDAEVEENSSIANKLAKHKLAENNAETNVRKMVTLMQENFVQLLNNLSEQLSNFDQLNSTS